MTSILIPVLLILVIMTLLIALIRAATGPRVLPPAKPLDGAVLAEMAGIEDELALCVRRATISSYERGQEDDSAFAAFKEDLKALYPKVHTALERREIGDRALLYTWKGSEAGLKPVILCAHFDVVPADDAAEWRHGPFSGDIVDGELWGRGTQDIKVMLVSALGAAERLLSEGFAPKRTILFAFGGDEEIGGNRGASRIGAELERQGIKASFLLDEGGPVSKGMLAFADRPLALVGIAEKGYIDVLLEAEGKGGHASMPPRHSATGNLARAVAAIEAQPSPASLGYTVRSFLGRLSPYVPFAYRILFRNLWLTTPLVKLAFSGAPTTNAMLRTTAAPTMLSGSAKENVLADRAWANINMRILPGESVEGTLKRVSRIVAPLGVKACAHHPAQAVEPLPESPVDHEGYRAVEAALAEAFPDAAAVPFLFSAGTDTKHYRRVAEAMYRFTPLAQTSADLAGIHGRDERVEVGNLRRCAIFYKRLIAGL